MKNFSLFAIISSIYLTTRWVIFKGFNGTDDLHYAMLAANMLKGTYNPFASGDIFSGRVLLIAWQALFYRVGGVTVFTTQAPVLLAVLLSAYLTVFKLCGALNVNAVIIASSLFYFNPVLTYATDGILPDAYVMLAGIACILLFNKSLKVSVAGKNIFYGAAIAGIVMACFFFKETAVVFPVLFVCAALIERKRSAIITAASMLCVLAILSCVCGAVYYQSTGNIFFRLQQASNSSYYNPCSYDLLPASFLIARLTYEVWLHFIVTGFYPILFAVCILFYKMFKKRDGLKRGTEKYFALVLLIVLYLPFSFKGYQPLCSDSTRHFLLLLPFAVCVCAPCFDNDTFLAHNASKWLCACIAILILCVICTPDKWQWMEWYLLIVYFAVEKFIRNPLFTKWAAAIFASILWLCMPYRLFYDNSNWFADMRSLNEQITGDHFYFADHDNMMHWKLLHGFADTIHCYNIAPAPYAVFKQYYDTLPATFTPGWLLVNKAYTERTDAFLACIDSLKRNSYFENQIAKGDIAAYYLSTGQQLVFIKSRADGDVKLIK